MKETQLQLVNLPPTNLYGLKIFKKNKTTKQFPKNNNNNNNNDNKKKKN